MTETVTIALRELADYGERQKRGELTILRMTTLPHHKGYQLLISDAPYQTYKKPAAESNDNQP